MHVIDTLYVWGYRVVSSGNHILYKYHLLIEICIMATNILLLNDSVIFNICLFTIVEAIVVYFSSVVVSSSSSIVHRVVQGSST